MKGRTPAAAEQLLGPLLQSVSRSFYISIRFLPRRLRQPVGLAYLLARATDTLADTATVPVAVRKSALQTLSCAIQQDGDADAIVQLQSLFVPMQTNKASEH